jgi:biotin-(acetyl-CoA carboxylase) ligase
VEIRGAGPAWQGRARGSDVEGYLEVETEDGEIQRVIGGEVRLLD